MGFKYLAHTYTPGYLPEGDPYVCDTPREAWECLKDERMRHLDDCAGEDDMRPYTDDYAYSTLEDMEGNEVEQGAVYGVRLDCDPDTDLGIAYSVTRVNAEDVPDYLD